MGKKRPRIVDVHAVDGDWRSLAVDLGVPQPTAYHWSSEGDKKDSRGGDFKSKVTSQHKDAFCKYIEENPRINVKFLKKNQQ